MIRRHLFRFESETAISRAVAVLHEQGRHDFETYSPYPLECMMEAELANHGHPPGEADPQNSPGDFGRDTSPHATLIKSPDSARPDSPTVSRLKFYPRMLSIAAFLGGAGGAVLGYWMQYFTEVTQFPRMVSDRPQHSWPAFIPVTFEMTVLGAAIAIFVAFFLITGLPQLHHAVFDVPGFDRASQDQFFIEMKFEDGDPGLKKWTSLLNAAEVSDVEL